jgi:ABC-type transporter Mla maintaining outer membrane lipid asymmetry ATPase subunit MlaF
MSATTAQMIEESKSHPSIKVNQLINWTKITATFGNRQILNLASGEVFAGRLLCVLGPSGNVRVIIHKEGELDGHIYIATFLLAKVIQLIFANKLHYQSFILLHTANA